MIRSGSLTSTSAAGAVIVLALLSGCSSPAPALSPDDGGDPDTIAVLHPEVGSIDAGSDTDNDGPNCDASVTYASFGMTFFETYCGRCHRWDQGSAQESGDILSAAAGPGGFMPPADPRPTDQERARLVAWIACGAP